MPVKITFVPNANFVRTFETPGGMVGRYVKRKGDQTRDVAKVLVGVDTGKLKRSIRTGNVDRHPRGFQVEVGSKLPYAYAHHQGTPPHTIRPRAGGVLHWGTRRGGPTVAVVHHPGTRGTKYLSRALRIAMRRL
jgi:hypothetical protein